MKVSKEFIKAWRAWNRITEVPVRKSDYRTDSSLREILVEFDHLDSYTYSLGLGVISGSIIGTAKIAADDIITIDRLAAEIQKCNISEATRTYLETYIKATRILLEEVTRLPQE